MSLAELKNKLRTEVLAALAVMSAQEKNTNLIMRAKTCRLMEKLGGPSGAEELGAYWPKIDKENCV